MELTAISDYDMQVLHNDLAAYFRWKRAPFIEDQIQETLLRVLEKVRTGEQIANLKAYARRVGELVLMEELRLLRVQATLTIAASVDSDSKLEHLSTCLDNCRKSCLTRREDRLVTLYYEADAQHRKLLAAAMKISDGELRKRAWEIRKKLRACLDECMRNSGR